MPESQLPVELIVLQVSSISLRIEALSLDPGGPGGGGGASGHISHSPGCDHHGEPHSPVESIFLIEFLPSHQFQAGNGSNTLPGSVGLRLSLISEQ